MRNWNHTKRAGALGLALFPAHRRDQGISETTPAFVVTDESCQPCEVSAEHVAARIQVTANDDAFPRCAPKRSSSQRTPELLGF